MLLVLLGPVIRIGSGKASVSFGTGLVVCVGSEEAAGRQRLDTTVVGSIVCLVVG